MALQINKTKDGKTATHLDIQELYWNKHESYLVARLHAYANRKDMDDANKGLPIKSLFFFQFSMSGADFPDVTKPNLSKIVLAFIKNSPLYGGWSNAVDV